MYLFVHDKELHNFMLHQLLGDPVEEMGKARYVERMVNIRNACTTVVKNFNGRNLMA
jgi:hypothetical protein